MWALRKKILFTHPKLGKGIVYEKVNTDGRLSYHILFFTPQERNDKYGIDPAYKLETKRIKWFAKEYVDSILSESRRWVKPKKKIEPLAPLM